MAIETGYRHLDGALVYFNEHEVGQAIREKIADGTVKREDIFYCGKVCKVCSFVQVSERCGCFGLSVDQLTFSLHSYKATATLLQQLIYLSICTYCAVVEHVPPPRIGTTYFGENLEDVTAGLCRPLYCRNAHSLQGTHAFNVTLKRHLL